MTATTPGQQVDENRGDAPPGGIQVTNTRVRHVRRQRRIEPEGNATQVPDCNYGFCLPCALRMANYDKRCPHCRNTQWYEDLKPLYQLPDDPPQRQATIDEVNEDLTRDALATIQEADQQQRR